MKTLHFASILALVAMTAFACRDDDDALPGANTSGKAGAAGENGDSAGAGGKSGGGANAMGGKGGLGGTEASGAGGVGDLPDAFAGSGGTAGADGIGGEGGGGETGGAAGAGGEVNAPGAPLEIIGEWVDNYGGDQIIDATSWNAATIVAYDNATNTVYAQNSPDDQYNPSKFTKTVYTDPVNDSFYFCLIVYSAETLEAAQADATVADPSSPETGGCSTFPWSKASKP